MEVVYNLKKAFESQDIDDTKLRRKLTFDRKVWAANNLAAGGASGERSRTLQVFHASDYALDYRIDTVRSRTGPDAKWEITECWKSCSHEFAFSSEALSGVPEKTFSAASTP